MRTGPDILRRFTTLPFVADLLVFGRAIRLETNSPIILQNVHAALEGCGPACSSTEGFVWRLVSDSEADLTPPWPDFSAFSTDGLHCENIDQRSFFAVDPATRMAVGFLADDLVNDALGFEEFFISRLFAATAVSLGLIAVSAACIAKNDKGLLVFGPTGIGKTVCCYAASKAGFQLHSDQVVFLDLQGDRLRAWGDFWPVAFYQGAENLFPELSALARPVQHKVSTPLCVERHRLSAFRPAGVSPIGLVVLQEEPSNAFRVVPLEPSRGEAIAWENCLCGRDEHSRLGLEGILRALGHLPAYRLACKGDPFAVVEVFLGLFRTNA